MNGVVHSLLDSVGNDYEMRIQKRDGRVVEFDRSKISDAISKSFASIGNSQNRKVSEALTSAVIELLIDRHRTLPTVEQVQDIVEEVLMTQGFSACAKAYILYRAERSRQRDFNNRLMRTYADIYKNDVKGNDLLRDNANIDCQTPMGIMLKYGSEGTKHFNLEFVIKPEHAAAHRDGSIHIHDLDFLTMTTTCCQIDIVKLFDQGFTTGHGSIREPNAIATYAALACIAIQSNQNDQHGGQSIPNFDYGMALGVAKTFHKNFVGNLNRYFDAINLGELRDEDLAYLIPTSSPVWKHIGLKEVTEEGRRMLEDLLMNSGICASLNRDIVSAACDYAHKHAHKETDTMTFQAMESVVHNLCSMHSRAGAQVPFSSINYGTDTSPEGRMVIKNILLALEKGLGHGEAPIFPIHIFRVMEGVNYNATDPNYDLFQLSMKVSAKRLFPTFSFQDAPFNKVLLDPERPETLVSYMGCRTRVMANVYNPSQQVANGRGNLSFTSINLPRIAIESNGSINDFFLNLDRTLELVIAQLLERFAIQAKKKVKNFPFLMGQGIWLGSEYLDNEDTLGEVLKNGTLSVGFIGLAETLIRLTGKHHGEDQDSQALGLQIVQFMRDRCDEKSQEYKMNFTLLASPAEGLSGRFTTIDRKLYGIIPGVTDKEYYTNSFHVPVTHNMIIYDKIRIEAPYHALTNAGHITFIELDGDSVKNLQAFEQIIRCMKEEGIGYGAVNHPIDRDPICGYTGIIDNECPKCGRTEDDGITFERLRRITGYLVGSVERFNDAKRAEERDRVKHTFLR